MPGTPLQPGESLADLTERRCADLVRRATGIAHLDVTLVPPVPGFAGVADAHNLAWKLAVVVKGQAGPALPSR
ncbi:FAD-dependent monooxygenase [Nonomuraea rhodomycinica]|uniref:FAD-dependent monooxygenase n=1 Tax=Nonomuraea rhodomycinica TaxID=1712872 RepID=A0A7Y6MA24_9ACTN|nr:FAD-dependent monooxygenase [Nonomuraea rhodomycinica]NUW39395.1 FAD-dependent monooxygenase [Nonomuraea rhodomycinica]